MKAQPLMIEVMIIDKVSNTLIKIERITLAQFAHYKHLGAVVTSGSIVKVYI